MVWRIVAKGGGRHEVVAVPDVGGMAHSCGVTNDPLHEIESFIFQYAKPNDMVAYPDGTVAKVSGTALA